MMKRSFAIWAAALMGLLIGGGVFKSSFRVSFGGIEMGPADPLRWWGGLALMMASSVVIIWLCIAAVTRRLRQGHQPENIEEGS